MIKWALRRAIDKFERDWNYDAGYMREIIDASPRAGRLRFLVQRSGHGTGTERGCVPTACRSRTGAGARSAAPRRHRAAGACGRDRCEACAAHVRIRGGNTRGRSQCADQLLASDVRVVTDGGGKVAARRPAE
jgi:hypothetical protein